MINDEGQLDLFGTAPVAAPERPAAIPVPPEAIEAADDAGAHEAGLIPARCPVTHRRNWCIRAGCRHWNGNRCGHPQAVRRPRRRGRRR